MNDSAPYSAARSAADSLEIAVLLPAHNEEAAIAAVVQDFRRAIPSAQVYVYDNNSTDRTAEAARRAGAIVRGETRQGKGFVVRRMFADVEADVYIMCDADATYDAGAAPALIERLMRDGLDMVVGARTAASNKAYRTGHAFGNRMLTALVRRVFGDGFRDILSGYRAFSRRFVKSFPVMSHGFEIETELTIHALELEMPAAEISTVFRERVEGSESKLSTLSDGARILWTILVLLKQERPLVLFNCAALAFALLSLACGWPVLAEYLASGTVPRLPTAVLAMGLMLLAALSLFAGLILDTVSRGRQEAKRLRYLELPGVHALEGTPLPSGRARFAPHG